jgi:ankyrin repeat protein
MPNQSDWYSEEVSRAMVVGDRQRVEELVRSIGIDLLVWRSPTDGWSPLHLPLVGFSIDPGKKGGDYIRYLIDEGVPVDAADVHGNTPLWYAIHGDHVEATRVLLEAGADPNREGEHQVSPMREAVWRRPVKWTLLEMMIERGGDPDARLTEGLSIREQAALWLDTPADVAEYERLFEVS